MSRWNASLVACALLSGCSDETRVNPVPLAAAPADASIPTTDAGDAATDAPSKPEAGPHKRDVLYRSPFGNLQATGNLLFDGDFEWSGAGSGAWVGASSTEGQVELRLETGGLCRSGLRCAALDNSYDMLGYGTRASHAAVDVSFWAKVPDTNCAVVSGYVLSIMNYTILLTMKRDADAPGVDGWCRFHAVLPLKLQEGIGVYITAEKLDDGKRVLIDDVVAVAADGLSPMSLTAGPAPEGVPQRMARGLDIIRRNRWLGTRPEPLPVP